MVREKRTEGKKLCEEILIFHLFKYMKTLTLKPATGIEHKAYIFISKNSG